VPVVSAVGHEQDTPLCDLAADVRASTPSVAGRLVVPDLEELQATLAARRERLENGATRTLERHRDRLDRTRERLRRAPALLCERRRARLEQAAAQLRALSPRATLERGYAIVRSGDDLIRSAVQVGPGRHLAVELADGSFGATVD
jgi:exodeoxyribonuclease VII large subunit